MWVKTSRWPKQNSGVCEITNYPIQKITKDKLYGISHRLYEVKDALEQHLSRKTNELFDITDNVYLFDLTNTYFEGAMRSSTIAKFGKSKEKRNDARLIVLALVINQYGFARYSHLLECNMADTKSLEEMIQMLVQRTTITPHKPLIVVDAGISSENNLQRLSQLGFDYICLSRKKYKTIRSPASHTL
jgi:transposase